ncbi:SRPBCC domain-containing protein [Nannocystis punicea]|uniref:SRPBCC domain-containing protein n=1 Tax=Nannocystis punicea TaxID=2995304 RepID=A0ABY7HCC9_9BACT|nr:SRPBCC domain-containing protein [Nannocystis poenicansa]WAS96755.1 SRPBCC domain-containing protein [Nannocystis poenicansa]
MSARIRGDAANVTVSVAVPPELAFSIFTEEIDQWWRRGSRYRVAGKHRGIIHLEPQVGGRLFESFTTDDGERVVETGRVLVWEPPTRLVFEWRASNFAPSERTEVEVVFTPSGDGTMVHVQHRGWSELRPDHPVRHGQAAPAFLRGIGLWWGDLMTALREHAAARPPPP